MASPVKPVSCLVGNDHNPLTMSDEQILKEIYSTHVPSHTKFDVDSLFTLVENILKRSTHIVDNVVHGNHGNLEQTDDNIPQASFTSPLCILKQITYEMSCKPPGEENAHNTTLAILNKLLSYSWDAKAVLTLAAFALEYGEFWMLYVQQSTEPLAKSLAIIKRVPTLTKPSALQKHRLAILELNNLITATWQVIELIFELKKLNLYHTTNDVPALGPTLKEIPVNVYWAIITIVAIVTQIDCLTTDSEERQELSHFGQKINIILIKLRKQMLLCQHQIAEAEYYKTLEIVFQTPTAIVEVLKLLIFGKSTPKAPIYDGDTKKMVDIGELKGKNVFLFISTLDITLDEISILNPIYDTKKSENQYKIVWVPIVEEWNDLLRKKFKLWKSKMLWYVLEHFEPIKGFKFIKEKWQFKKKPMVVVLNPQGTIEHHNAFHMIQFWGLDGFPFTQRFEQEITQQATWIQPLVININQQIPTWINDKRYIFFYGGKNKEWIQQFNKFVDTLTKDVTIGQEKISIEQLCLEDEHPNIMNQFWSGIESLFVTNMHMKTNTVTREVRKMHSYKNDKTGWVLLTLGSTVVLAGQGTTVLKVAERFDTWKEQVVKKGFEITFKEQYDDAVCSTHSCSLLEIHSVAGNIPDNIECPECHATMKVFFSYKCCHKENIANAIAEH